MSVEYEKSEIAEVSPQEAKNCENDIPVHAYKKHKTKFFTTGNLAVIGILTAVSFVLYVLVKFPLPFLFPGWLDIQFSDLPALLGGFALGPVAGCIIIVLKCCLKMPMTTTACVGEFADIIVGIAFVLPASLIYRHHKSKKGAIVGMSIGSVCAVCMSVLANRLVLIPFYANMFGEGDYLTGLSKIVAMVNVLYEGVTTDNFYYYYLPLAVVPFNILRSGICAVLTYFTYKPLSKVLHWETRAGKRNRENNCK